MGSLSTQERLPLNLLRDYGRTPSPSLHSLNNIPQYGNLKATQYGRLLPSLFLLLLQLTLLFVMVFVF